ncbi:MAG: DUF502 domain-containing protein [Gammaproteobacteria bacterium]|nr:DUF502 domain-containing protein [Gammaproteobacteria bacterium]
MTFRELRTIFLTGLAVVLPIVVTLWVLWWIGAAFETFLGGMYSAVIPERYYFPGLGILLGIALTLAVGFMAKALLFRSLFAWWDTVLNRIPLVKTIYGALGDFMRLVSGDAGEQFNRVVIVEFDQPAMKLIGFVTREDLSQFPDLLDDSEVAVYFPMSYQVGGYTLFLPKSRLQPVNMRMEDALRFVLTAGLSAREAPVDDRA